MGNQYMYVNQMASNVNKMIEKEQNEFCKGGFRINMVFGVSW